MKCDICKENFAILEVYGEKERQYKKCCITCAYRNKLKEAIDKLEKLGINADNAESMQNLINEQSQLLFTEENKEKIDKMISTLFSNKDLFNSLNLKQEKLSTKQTNSEDKKESNSILGNKNYIDNNKSIKSEETSISEKKVEKETNKDENNKTDRSSKNNNLMEQLMSLMEGKEGIFKIFKSDGDNVFDFKQFAFQDVTGEEQDVSEATNSSTNSTENNNLSKLKFLAQYATNLNDLARSGKLDRIIGREVEIQRIIQILNRRSKNNPVLIGEPGVGKTALAEGLATKIVNREVPLKLAQMEVYLVDMAAMVAGTQFRGQFESRLKGLLKEAREFKNIILVIDELHNIVGAGHAEGTMNAANILKPALARGEIRILGSTTLVEYRKFIEEDKALERRFQKVLIEEPSQEETIEMLKQNRSYYEKYHNVTYSDTIINEVVRLSSRYIQDRFFPDKAFDLIDEAGSSSNLSQIELMEYEQKQNLLKEKEEKLLNIETQLEEHQSKGEPPLSILEERAFLQEQKSKIYSEIEDLKQKIKPREIKIEDIASVVELWTGIPVKSLTETDREKLLNMKMYLRQHIIGQDEAINKVSKALIRTRSGLRSKSKPVSFIFVGSTGVGKTEMVKAVTKILLGTEKKLIRLDMSEYMEAHTVSKLIGSPPGYVGHEEAGQLSEQVRRNPYSVILLDEIEKAHKDVYNMLLQILDDGRLTDSKGRVIDFSNTLIFMTSNAGTSFKKATIGFLAEEKKALEEQAMISLKKFFRPEFLNRIDDIIFFTPLTYNEQADILNKLLTEFIDDLSTQEIKLEITESAKSFILEKGYSVQYGARPLKRAVTNYVEDLMAYEFLNGRIKQGSNIRIVHKAEEEELAIEYI